MSRTFLFIGGILFIVSGIALLPVLTTATLSMGAFEKLIIPLLPFLFGIGSFVMAFIKKGEADG